MEERRAGRRLPRRALLPAALVAAGAAAVAVALPAAFEPRRGSLTAEVPLTGEGPMTGAEAERLLADRYPRLRRTEGAVIACPRRRIEPGGEARCWVLARVGLQRAVVVRVPPDGDTVEIDD